MHEGECMALFSLKDMGKKEETLWCQKHRPINLDTYIGNDHIKNKVKGWIETNDPPHILFYGKPGTGKTTLAKIIVNNIYCDYIYINASDETSVDVVRTKVKGFASSIGFKDLKIIILDEFDFMTPNAQASLRNIMETFSVYTRFILTCNYHEKVMDAIFSRCQDFEIIPPSKKDMAILLSNILNKEGITFDIKTIALLVNKHFPDIRKLINSAQTQSINGELKIDQKVLIDSDFKLKLIDLLQTSPSKKQAFQSIRKLIADNHISSFSEIYRLLYDELDNIFPGHVANAILIIAEGQYKESFVVDKEIPFCAVLINLIELKFK